MTAAEADTRARLATLWERAHADVDAEGWPTVTALHGGDAPDDLPPGFAAWAVGPWPDDPAEAPEAGRHVVVVPALVPDAPLSVRRRLLARIAALGCGRCPLCGGVAGLEREPPAPGEAGRAAFYALPLRIAVRHAHGCPAYDWTQAERRWFVPYRTDFEGAEGGADGGPEGAEGRS